MSDEKAGVGVFLVQIVIELMYIIDFYRTEKGECDIEDYGTRLGENVTKHLEEDIWELRPGNNMSDWTKYKNKVRDTNPDIGKDLDEIEEVSAIVGAMIEQRHNLELSQRDLAKLCGIPHSIILPQGLVILKGRLGSLFSLGINCNNYIKNTIKILPA